MIFIYPATIKHPETDEEIYVCGDYGLVSYDGSKLVPVATRTSQEASYEFFSGLGPLPDVTKCVVKETINGTYECSLQYPVSGENYDLIQENRVILVKPNQKDPEQLFRIYRINDDIAGMALITAYHISYDLSGQIVRGMPILSVADSALDVYDPDKTYPSNSYVKKGDKAYVNENGTPLPPRHMEASSLDVSSFDSFYAPNYDENKTYNLGSIVSYEVDGVRKNYIRTLKEADYGHDPTDTSRWEVIKYWGEDADFTVYPNKTSFNAAIKSGTLDLTNPKNDEFSPSKDGWIFVRNNSRILAISNGNKPFMELGISVNYVNKKIPYAVGWSAEVDSIEDAIEIMYSDDDGYSWNAGNYSVGASTIFKDVSGQLITTILDEGAILNETFLNMIYSISASSNRFYAMARIGYIINKFDGVGERSSEVSGAYCRGKTVFLGPLCLISSDDGLNWIIEKSISYDISLFNVSVKKGRVPKNPNLYNQTFINAYEGMTQPGYTGPDVYFDNVVSPYFKSDRLATLVSEPFHYNSSLNGDLTGFACIEYELNNTSAGVEKILSHDVHVFLFNGKGYSDIFTYKIAGNQKISMHDGQKLFCKIGQFLTSGTPSIALCLFNKNGSVYKTTRTSGENLEEWIPFSGPAQGTRDYNFLTFDARIDGDISSYIIRGYSEQVSSVWHNYFDIFRQYPTLTDAQAEFVKRINVTSNAFSTPFSMALKERLNDPNHITDLYLMSKITPVYGEPPETTYVGVVKDHRRLFDDTLEDFAIDTKKSFLDTSTGLVVNQPYFMSSTEMAASWKETNPPLTKLSQVIKTTWQEGTITKTSTGFMNEIQDILMPETHVDFWFKYDTEENPEIKGGSFVITSPMSLRAILGDVLLPSFHDETSGRMFEVYFDNDQVWLKKNGRGEYRDWRITYGQDLERFTVENDTSDTYTCIYPYFYTDNSGLVDLLTLGYTEALLYPSFVPPTANQRIYPLDLSTLADDAGNRLFESAPTTYDQIKDAVDKFNEKNHIMDKTVSFTLSTVQMKEDIYGNVLGMLNEIELGDTMDIWVDKFGYSETLRIVECQYNVLTGRYDSLTFGKNADAVSNVLARLEQRSYNITKQVAQKSATTSFVNKKIEEVEKKINNKQQTTTPVTSVSDQQFVLPVVDICNAVPTSSSDDGYYIVFRPDLSLATVLWKVENGTATSKGPIPKTNAFILSKTPTYTDNSMVDYTVFHKGDTVRIVEGEDTRYIERINTPVHEHAVTLPAIIRSEAPSGTLSSDGYYIHYDSTHMDLWKYVSNDNARETWHNLGAVPELNAFLLLDDYGEFHKGDVVKFSTATATRGVTLLNAGGFNARQYHADEAMGITIRYRHDFELILTGAEGDFVITGSTNSNSSTPFTSSTFPDVLTDLEWVGVYEGYEIVAVTIQNLQAHLEDENGTIHDIPLTEFDSIEDVVDEDVYIATKVDGTTITYDSNGRLKAIGGGGSEYFAGDAIDIDSDNYISVKYGKGLTIDVVTDELMINYGDGLEMVQIGTTGKYKIQPKLGDGLTFLNDGADIGVDVDDDTIKINRYGQLYADVEGISYDPGNGIDITNDVISIKLLPTNSGLDVGASGLYIPLMENGGLTIEENELFVKVDRSTININGAGALYAVGGGGSYSAGYGVDISNNAISVLLGDGLKFEQILTTGKYRIQPSLDVGLTFLNDGNDIGVNVDESTIGFNNDDAICVNYGRGLTVANPTGTYRLETKIGYGLTFDELGYIDVSLGENLDYDGDNAIDLSASFLARIDGIDTTIDSLESRVSTLESSIPEFDTDDFGTDQSGRIVISDSFKNYVEAIDDSADEALEKVSELGDRMDVVETGLSGKASQSALDSLSSTVSGLSKTVGDILLDYVGQSAFMELSSTVSVHTTNIAQLETDVSSKITESDATDLFDDLIVQKAYGFGINTDENGYICIHEPELDTIYVRRDEIQALIQEYLDSIA